MANNKHLTDYERDQIEYHLKEGMPLKRIAEKLGRSTSTISREIRARSVDSDKGAYGRSANYCSLRKECIKHQICDDKPNCTKRCANCKHCNEMCPDFEEEICLRLYEPPYVCNGCIDERICTL